MRQFGRQYRLVLGSEENGLVIDSLRVTFEFTKDIDNTPNKAEIRIWNLNREHREWLYGSDFRKVWLWAGYSELRLLYAGDITAVALERKELDNVIVLTCNTGDTDMREARVSTTLAAGSTANDHVKVAVASMTGTTPGQVVLPKQRPLPRGKVLSGLSRDVLSEVAAEQGADWSIQDGDLLLLPAGYVLDDQAVFLSQDTGLIGAPKEIKGGGLELTCLIDPAPRVGGTVRLKSIEPRYDGDYKIVTINSKGDVMEKDWYCVLSVIGGEFQKKDAAKTDKGGKGNG